MFKKFANSRLEALPEPSAILLDIDRPDPRITQQNDTVPFFLCYRQRSRDYLLGRYFLSGIQIDETKPRPIVCHSCSDPLHGLYLRLRFSPYALCPTPDAAQALHLRARCASAVRASFQMSRLQTYLCLCQRAVKLLTTRLGGIGPSQAQQP
jgi:hypothetical protein